MANGNRRQPRNRDQKGRDPILQGRRALVTGAARGIGRGIAEELAQHGAHVVIADLESALASMQGAVSSITRGGGRASYVTMDVSDLGSMTKALDQIKADGPIDILVNNAGIANVGLFARQPVDAIARMLAVNLQGAVLLTRLVLPGMLERNWGRILFVASIQGIAGTPGFVTYSATKGGMVRFAEALTRELSHHDIGITTVLPPAVKTEAFQKAQEEAPSLLRWSLFRPVPIEQVAHRAVRGMLLRQPLVYAGTQSVLASVANRMSHSLMGLILMKSFREEKA